MRQRSLKTFTYTVFKTPLGYMGAAKTRLGTHTVILPRKRKNEVMKILMDRLGQDCIEDGSGFISFYREISDYFSGKNVSFGGSIDGEGTSDFERRVWSAAASIPWGQVRSYEWVARSIGRPGACRAVGRALSRNRLPIIIPCHRVTKKDGGLGGFADGPAMKISLLKIEGRAI
jgi:methylated-DNA-[protein]-cysteine S-methyltransferase